MFQFYMGIGEVLIGSFELFVILVELTELLIRVALVLPFVLRGLSPCR